MKIQKVVTVNVLTRTESNSGYKELEFPVLAKYFDEGYTVKEFHQITTSPNLFVVTFTFILEKNA